MLQKFGKRLLEATKDCREDMHEPDEQGISAIVTGYNLDNAMGDEPYNNCGEFTVAIVQDDGHKEWFNLATMIALARIGAKSLEVAQQSVNPTFLQVRRKLVTCPNCQNVFGVELPAPQSG